MLDWSGRKGTTWIGDLWRPLARRIGAAPLALALLATTGCGITGDRIDYLDGAGVEPDAAALHAYVERQDAILTDLARAAGLQSVPANNSDEWTLIVLSGMEFADQECERYIDSIFWYSRYRKTLSNQVNLIGVATIGIEGLLEAAARDIAITALAFGLVGQSIENLTSTLLYQIDPSSIRLLLEEQQRKYTAAVQNVTYTNRPAAVGTIRNYLALCLPSTLETEVNNAVASARFEVQNAIPPTGARNVTPSLTQTEPAATGQGGSDRGGSGQGGAGLAGTTDLGADQLVEQENVPTGQEGAIGPFETVLSRDEVIAVQRALCIASPSGNFDSATRAQIAVYRQEERNSANAMLDDGDIARLTATLGPCNQQFQTYFERKFFAAGDSAIRNFQAAIGVTQTGAMDAATRAKIGELQAANQLPVTGTIPDRGFITALSPG